MGVNNRGSQLATTLVKLPGVKSRTSAIATKHALAKGIAAATSDGAAAPKAIKDFRHALDDKSVDALVCSRPEPLARARHNPGLRRRQARLLRKALPRTRPTKASA